MFAHWEFDHIKQQCHVDDLDSAQSSTPKSRMNFTSQKLVPHMDTGDLQVPDYVEVQIPLIPIFRQGVPMGICIFQTSREYKECVQDYKKLADRYDRHISKLNAELAKDDDRDEDIKFPQPASKHVYCGVCQTEYDNYIVHVRSMGHLACVEADVLYGDIDKMIDSMN